MNESERIAIIKNAVLQSEGSKIVKQEFKEFLDNEKAEKLAEELVLAHGLLPVSDDDVKEEFVSLDAVESDKDEIDENDEEQTDMDCVSGSFVDLFDTIES
jgi:hypothetical protein